MGGKQYKSKAEVVNKYSKLLLCSDDSYEIDFLFGNGNVPETTNVHEDSSEQADDASRMVVVGGNESLFVDEGCDALLRQLEETPNCNLITNIMNMLPDDSEVLHDNPLESGAFDAPDFNILPEQESSRTVLQKFELFGGDIGERDQDRAWVDEACPVQN